MDYQVNNKSVETSPMKKLLSVLAVSAAVMAPAAFASSPVMFSTINGFNAPDSDAVGGVRLALLHGQVNDLKGLDLAVVGMSETQTTTGVNLGIFGASKSKPRDDWCFTWFLQLEYR